MKGKPAPGVLAAAIAICLLLALPGAATAQGGTAPAPAPPGKKPPAASGSPPSPARTQAPDTLELTIRSRFALGADSQSQDVAAGGSSAGADPSQKTTESQAAQAPQAAAAARSAPVRAAPTGARPPEWSAPLRKSTISGSPVEVRMMGPNLVALVLIVPFETGGSALTLNVQGQVWLKLPDGSLSYKSTLQTLVLPMGERLTFYPLGVDPQGEAPIALEIGVDRPQ